MDSALERLIESFSRLRVLVVGDVMLDGYLDGSTDRLCREAPVPVVSVHERAFVPGGAGNTAANAAALGTRASLLAVTGDDRDGGVLREVLRERGVDTSAMVADPRRRTLAKRRVTAQGQMVVRFDEGCTHAVDGSAEADMLRLLGRLWDDCDAVVCSDYGYGVLSQRILRAIGALQRWDPRVLVADSKRLTAYRDLDVTAVKPNYGEAVQLLDACRLEEPGLRVPQMTAEGQRLLELTGARIAALTLDTQGALLFERGCPPYRTYAQPRPHSRAAGAGDTFLATLTSALAAGGTTPHAAELASSAAAIVVGKEGTAACSAQELKDAFGRLDKRLRGTARLGEVARRYREHGKRVVFTNGCFDILHRGHVSYLNRAKELGDVLFVGVNDDDSVRRLKGTGRPVNSLEDRLQVLSALSCVDHVAEFEGDRPDEIIAAVRPHVFVKGGDYTVESLPEAPLVREMGGVIEILPLVEDRSTTGIIERIRDGHACSACAGDSRGVRHAGGRVG